MHAIYLPKNDSYILYYLFSPSVLLCEIWYLRCSDWMNGCRYVKYYGYFSILLQKHALVFCLMSINNILMVNKNLLL